MDCIWWIWRLILSPCLRRERGEQCRDQFPSWKCPVLLLVILISWHRLHELALQDESGPKLIHDAHAQKVVKSFIKYETLQPWLLHLSHHSHTIRLQRNTLDDSPFFLLQQAVRVGDRICFYGLSNELIVDAKPLPTENNDAETSLTGDQSITPRVLLICRWIPMIAGWIVNSFHSRLMKHNYHQENSAPNALSQTRNGKSSTLRSTYTFP